MNSACLSDLKDKLNMNLTFVFVQEILLYPTDKITKS